jgi:hypothetical protein
MRRNEISLRALRKKGNLNPRTARCLRAHRERFVLGVHGASMLVVRVPVWTSLPVTNRTTFGAYEARPFRKVTNTVVAGRLRRVTVRRPTDRREVGHPFSSVSVRAFQLFMTVASRVTRNATRLGCFAASAVPARNARRPTRTTPPVTAR